MVQDVLNGILAQCVVQGHTLNAAQGINRSSGSGNSGAITLRSTEPAAVAAHLRDPHRAAAGTTLLGSALSHKNTMCCKTE